MKKKRSGLSPALRKGLAAYSTGAAAVLALAPAAEAAIISTMLAEPLVVNTSTIQYLDLNEDGEDDLYIAYVENFFGITGVLAGGMMIRSNGGYAVRLAAGDAINSARIMENTGSLAFLQSNDGGSVWRGQTGYIGMMFFPDGNMSNPPNFGWVKYQADDNYQSGKILGWGYEDSGADINAGDEGETLVELAAFAAAPGPQGVALSWETAAAKDTAGFHVWRSEQEQWGYERVTPAMIPARGSLTRGADYGFEDETAAPGQTWYYKLEDIDDRGTSTLHPPVSAWVEEPGPEGVEK